MSLLERLKTEIAAGGPIGVDVYMARCLHDPRDGYYATRPALGEDGDFITAPMVSQMFGELIGLWAVETWRRMGAPARVLLVEMGPGDGTLMSDVAARRQARARLPGRGRALAGRDVPRPWPRASGSGWRAPRRRPAGSSASTRRPAMRRCC